MTGLENGSFSLCPYESGRGCCRWFSKLLRVTDVSAVLAVKTAKPAVNASDQPLRPSLTVPGTIQGRVQKKIAGMGLN